MTACARTRGSQAWSLDVRGKELRTSPSSCASPGLWPFAPAAQTGCNALHRLLQTLRKTNRGSAAHAGGARRTAGAAQPQAGLAKRACPATAIEGMWRITKLYKQAPTSRVPLFYKASCRYSECHCYIENVLCEPSLVHRNGLHTLRGNAVAQQQLLNSDVKHWAMPWLCVKPSRLVKQFLAAN